MVKGSTVVVSIVIVASILFVAETEAGRKSPGKDIILTVFDLSTTFKSDDEFASVVSDKIRAELKDLGSFTVLGKDEVKKALSKHEFHYADTCKSPSCLSDLGHCIGVHRIITGSIASVNDYYNVVLKLLNVPRGEVTATVMADLKGEGESVESGEVKTLVENLMKKDGYTFEESSELKKTGKLLIDADRSGADIFIDGKDYEVTTPYTFEEFPIGKHRIVVSDKEGYGAKEITILSGDSHLVTVPLSSKKGAVHITSTPEKAKVIIDGKECGKTPLTMDFWVGSHQVVIEKKKYLTRELTVTVDSSGENKVDVELEGMAMLSVEAEPDYAQIYINGDYAGEGIVDDYSVEAGEVKISIEAPEYAPYKITETIEEGKTRSIEKKLDYLFGSLEVNSNPDTASLFLNDVEAGTTPYAHSRLRTGKYKLTLLKKNYAGIMEDVVVKPNEVLKRDYTLKFSKEYRDSLRRERWLSQGGRGVRRVLFCALGAVCGAAGYYFETKLQENKDNYTYWGNEYSKVEEEDPKQFAEIKDNYYQAYNQAEINESNRNIFYGIAGVCGAGFIISIFF